MDFYVLGPFNAIERGVSFTPKAAKPRTVLALLALSGDQVVPAATLMEELWPGGPPRSAVTTLQTYILHLRKLIGSVSGDDPKRVLRTERGGYILERGGWLDASGYETNLSAGRAAMQRRDFRAAMANFDAALGHWRGSPLSDVKAGPRLEVEIIRLEESRLTLMDWRVECSLMLGHHHDMLGELAGLTTQYPLHEALHGQYMLALCRSGRRSQALDVFRRLRSVLHAELGLEPSPLLQRLQRAVLVADPALELVQTSLQAFGS